MGTVALLLILAGVFLAYEVARSVSASSAEAATSGASSVGNAISTQTPSAPVTSSAGGVTTRNYGGVALNDSPVYPQGTVFSQAQLTQMAQSVGFSGQGLQNILHVINNESGGDPNSVYQGSIHSDAAGLLQFISTTAAGLGLTNRLDPMASLRAAYAVTKGGTQWCPSPWGPDFGCGYS